MKILRPIALFLVAAMFYGCVGYRLGSTLPPDIKSIYVPVFTNKTNEPLIESKATNATIAEFQKDGTLKIKDSENADVVIEVTLTKLSLSPLRYSKSDPRKPNEYRLTLYANYVLKRNATDEILAEERGLSGEATFIYAGNLTTAKQSAVPNASRDLAESIVESVVEYW